MTTNEQFLVFVVDDEIAIADVLTNYFREAGFAVETFYDSGPAFKRALESAPDVVVTDFDLPSFDGLRLAHLLQEHCPSCRTILISGDVASILRAEPELRFPVIEKPFNARALVESVKKIHNLKRRRE